MLVVFPIVAFVVRDRPQSIGLEPYGATEPVPVPERSTHPFRPAIDGLLLGFRSRTFWLLCATFFICGLSTNGLIGTHLIPAAIDHHLTEVTGASLLALMGLFDVIGTTCSGWLTDRLDPRYLLAWYYALRGLAVIALPYAFGSGYALVAFAVFYGLDWVATVPPTVALTADTFGRERVGIVFGWIFASHQIGAAAAAWGAGATRTWFGTYNYAFVSAGALCLLAAGLSLRIGKHERADRTRSRSLAGVGSSNAATPDTDSRRGRDDPRSDRLSAAEDEEALAADRVDQCGEPSNGIGRAHRSHWIRSPDHLRGSLGRLRRQARSAGRRPSRRGARKAPGGPR